MRIKQKYSPQHNALNHTDIIYEKNPRFKSHKLKKSKLIQFSDRCVLMKTFEHQQTQQQCLSPQKQSITVSHKPQAHQLRLATLSLSSKLTAHRSSSTNRYTLQNQNQNQNQGSICKVKRKAHQSRIDLQTIDVIKQQISKTLAKDLLSLKNIQDSLITQKTKNSIKIKFMAGKRKSTINYNQCCSLVNQNSQPNLLLKQQYGAVDVTPKLTICEGRSKKVAPLIYFLKKKQFTQRKQLSNKISLKQIVKKKAVCTFDDSQVKKICFSQRQKINKIQKNRQNMYSPWDQNVIDHNPEFSQFF